MSAHPMLQPTDWAQTPESLRAAMPEVGRQIYQVVWDSSLACGLRAPVLTHTRSIYAAGELSLAVASVAHVQDRLGYWRFRTDFPRWRFDHNTAQVNSHSARVRDAWAVQVPVVTMGGAIGILQAKVIGTAASTSGMLQELFCAKSPLVEYVQEGQGQSIRVKVTALGHQRVADWKRHTLLGQTAQVTRLVESVESAQLGYRQALTEIADDVDQAESAARYIDSLCAQWKGLGREEGLGAIEVGRRPLPHHEGLPQWLDPENKLPADHPLRATRQKMESDLTARHPEWLALTPLERSLARVDWIAVHRDELGAFLPQIEGMGSEFSALRYWLTGAS